MMGGGRRYWKFIFFLSKKYLKNKIFFIFNKNRILKIIYVTLLY
jgi:hypothetical protein